MLIRKTNKGKDIALHEAVRYGHYAVVRSLIEKDPKFTYGANDSSTTPLYMAAERGFTDLVELIIKKSSTSPSYHGLMGRTALHATDQIREQFEWVMPETKSLEAKKREREKKSRADEEKSLTAYDMILRHEENSRGEKDIFNKLMDNKKSKEDKEKRTSALREQGKDHLIVSALITTVTYVAGFTLPGGYNGDDGKAILSKKAAFGAFVVTDTIAMVSSLCAVAVYLRERALQVEPLLALDRRLLGCKRIGVTSHKVC
ncbi:ankyrin repeat-containing protein NPR4-like [Vitis riparia]|uniref:ankyrin repeat-containing protein NPR4-like n=1 Tax=Vitis riparia TaxID=96939 RepID=UPI00155AEF1F|nr:ankyrin repeat-containing protein NPR4-like [Vitis riparia]